jgi:predicted aspartyl protease
MRVFRTAAVIALTLANLNGSAPLTAQAPKIAKPRPAPPGIPPMLPLPPAVIDNKLLIGGEDVKAREIESRLSVDVHVNGAGPYKFIVDSGADTSAVGLKIAENLQLPLGKPVILNGMTSRSIVDRVKVAQLSMGPTTVRDLELPALRESHLGGDGLLGIDTLTKQRLLMDFEKKLIKVEDARRPLPFEKDAIVVTARAQRGQLILTHVKAVGLPLDAVIDTGSQVTIGNLALRNKLIRYNRDKFVTVPMIGVTGVTVNIEMATIANLEIGPIKLRNVPIAFADVPPLEVFGLSKEPALLLGTDLLETFRRVSLDFRARRVRFQLRNCSDAVVVRSSVSTTSYTRISAGQDPDVCGGD